MGSVITEKEFALKICEALANVEVDCVTGPGRSGAVAAVYASHILGVPFINFGCKIPDNLPRLLIIDTAIESGKTLKKAVRQYAQNVTKVIAVYQEPPRVIFWYEANKPQRYRHEQRTT